MRGRLPTRPLGSSGLDITPVGFGAWAIGGAASSVGWGSQDDAASGVSGAIVRARSAEQVDSWIGAASLELSTGDLNRIRTAIARTGAGAGPLRLAAVPHELAI